MSLTLLDNGELVAHRRLVCMVVVCLGSHSAADLDKAKYVGTFDTYPGVAVACCGGAPIVTPALDSSTGHCVG